MSTEYIFFNKIKVPSTAWMQDWNDEVTSYCSNWQGAKKMSDCDGQTKQIDINNIKDYKDARSYILKHDRVSDNGKWAYETCTPSTTPNSPAECNDLLGAKDSYVQNDYKNAYATEWTANNIYLQTKYLNNRLLSDASDYISLQVDQNAVNKGTNIPLNLFKGSCDNNQALSSINTSIFFRTDLAPDMNENSGKTQQKYYFKNIPTSIKYESKPYCYDIDSSFSTDTKSIPIDNNSLLTTNIDVNGAIYDIAIDENNKIIKYYKPNSNYNIISTTGEVFIMNPDVNLKMYYDEDKSTHTTFDLNNFTQNIDTNNKLNLTPDLLTYIKQQNIKLQCPATYYLSGYSTNKTDNKINIIPHCVKFVEKPESNNNGNDNNNNDNDTGNSNSGILYCPKDNDWPETKAGEKASIKCNSSSDAIMTRQCKSDGTWDEADKSSCEETGLSTWIIVLIVLGIILVIGILIFIVIKLSKKNNNIENEYE